MRLIFGLLVCLLVSGCGGGGTVSAPEKAAVKPADLKVEGSSSGGQKSGAGAAMESLKGL